MQESIGGPVQALPLWAQILGVVVPLLVAGLSAWQSIRANKTSASLESRKIDAEAFDRAVEIYESAISQMKEQLERAERQVEQLQSKLEGLMGELQREREMSSSLRAELAEIKVNARDLLRTFGMLKSRLSEIEVAALQDQVRRIIGEDPK